jgi:hypothetical protein
MRRTPILLALALTAAACGEPSPFPAATTGPPGPPPTTLPALPPSSTVPQEVTVDRLEWEGTVTIRARLGEAERLEGVATMTGAYASPGSHKVDLSLVVLDIDPSSDRVDREETTWTATVVGDLVSFSEDGRPFEIGSLSGGDAVEQLELLSTALGGIIPGPGLLSDLEGRPWQPDWSDGVPVMAFIIDDAPVERYGMLFGSGLVDDPLPGAEAGSLTVLLDPANGIVREARYVLEGDDDGASIDVVLSFRVIAVDDAAVSVFPPGVEPFEVPEGMNPFADPAGRFSIGIPAGWSVGDDDGDVVGFESPDGERYAAVRLESVEEGTTVEEYVAAVLADGASETEILERGAAEHAGLTWVRLDAGTGDVRVVAWLTVDGEHGIGFRYAAPVGEWGDAARDAAAMFSSFDLLDP